MRMTRLGKTALIIACLSFPMSLMAGTSPQENTNLEHPDFDWKKYCKANKKHPDFDWKKHCKPNKKHPDFDWKKHEKIKKMDNKTDPEKPDGKTPQNTKN